ncbi:MAG: tetratricopeptide repeat protein [Treponema sp.]|jgi:tetratricopeptide (TPR) repeat protein|nr:tetratricopeptide repeat protein [Treponema sp.]
MFDPRRLLFFIGNKLRRKKYRDDVSALGWSPEEKWEADFSKPAKSRFDIKSESSCDANLEKSSLSLSLRKTGCIAWVWTPGYAWGDQIIEARLRLLSMGGYAASGILFRMVDESSCYMLLVSNRGYFRLDVIRNNMPFPLIGWTETPAAGEESRTGETGFTIKVIAYGSRFTLFVNGTWAAELNDSSISKGALGFALASYEAGSGAGADAGAYTARAFLDALTVDSRAAEVEAAHDAWNGSPEIPPGRRFALAGTFAAMAEPNPALVQIRKAWEHAPKRMPGELLLASHLARQLELYEEAGEYADACLAEGPGPLEGEAAAEKAKILYASGQFGALKEYLDGEPGLCARDPAVLTLLGHALWNLGTYGEAAAVYDRAFDLDGENGLPAKNAANMYEMLGRKEEALNRYLEGGRAFLAADNYGDLGAIVPKLLSLGKDNWEAHALAGKWAFGIEDWRMAEAEFDTAEDLRKAARPKPHKDPALIFLMALLMVRRGKRRQAVSLFEDAVKYAPDYGLFRFRLAENRFLLDPDDPRASEDVNAALSLMQDGGESFGWASNLAAQIELHRGNPEAASLHLEKAAALLGEVPAIRVNRGALFFLRGSLDKALAVLVTDGAGDPEGLMANCAGNLLVRAERYEEADEQYRLALLRSPGNAEYLINRASCLVKLERYGEADEILARAHSRAPSPEILELISYVAVKKGEFSRAESAVRSALEMEGDHAPSLLSLGWLCIQAGRWDEAEGIIGHLDALELTGEHAGSREELRKRWENGVYRFISCASCERSWRMPKSQPPVPSIRLYAMPPDGLPAGSCPECGKTWCIGCAKEHLDPSGRFLCPHCGKPLKLIDEGLKKLISDWASAEIKPPAPEDPPEPPPPAAPPPAPGAMPTGGAPDVPSVVVDAPPASTAPIATNTPDAPPAGTPAVTDAPDAAPAGTPPSDTSAATDVPDAPPVGTPPASGAMPADGAPDAPPADAPDAPDTALPLSPDADPQNTSF